MGTENCCHLLCPLVGEDTVALFRPQRTGVTGDDHPGIGGDGALGQGCQQRGLFGMRQLGATEVEMHHRKLASIRGLYGPYLAGWVAVVGCAGEDEGLPVRHLHNLAQQGEAFLADLPGHERRDAQDQDGYQDGNQVDVHDFLVLSFSGR